MIRLNELRQEQDEFCKQLETVAKSLAYLINVKLNGTCATEDVYQETILAAWSNRKALTNPGNFKPWIYQIARNKCNDYFRQNGGDKSIPLEKTHELIANRFGYRGAVDEQKEELTYSLLTLDVNDKELIELLYYKELTLAQIAAKMAIPLGTVKRRLFDARRRLREEIRKGDD